jgi:hypothetical protein
MALTDLIHDWAAWLEATSPAATIASADILFPLFETVHVIGVALVIGTIAIVDLRLLGFASVRRTVTEVAAHMLPIAWVGFCIAVLSGVLMFMANASRYIDNRAFQLKFLVLLFAGINMMVFHRLTWRSVTVWDGAMPPPLAVKTAGAVSLSCWIVVVFLGRWIGFVE